MICAEVRDWAMDVGPWSFGWRREGLYAQGVMGLDKVESVTSDRIDTRTYRHCIGK